MRLEEKKDGYKNDYLFTGQERDEETGLMYYGARYYDPKVGRFMGVDPWEGKLEDPQTLNKYSYVNNNPLKYVDPTGKWPFMVFIDPTQGEVKKQVSNSSRGKQKVDFGQIAENKPITKTEAILATTIGGLATAGSMIPPAIRIINDISTVFDVAHEVTSPEPTPVDPYAQPDWLGSGSNCISCKGPDFRLNPNWKNWDSYMEKKGWTFDDIENTVNNGEITSYNAKENFLNSGNKMEIIKDFDTGRSLIRDAETKEIIQLGKKGYDF